MKQKIKTYLLKKLHAIERQQFDLTNTIASKGVKNFFELDFSTLRKEVMQFVNKHQIRPYTYKFAMSREQPCLYASVYAVMLEGLFGVLEQRGKEDLQNWADYINFFQNPDDGLYYDPLLMGDAYEHIGVWNEGWGKHHLMSHIIIALARLGHTPKYELKYLEKYYDDEYLKGWLRKFQLTDDVWTESNYVMNLYTVLQYARDYMDDKRAVHALEIILSWLKDNQNSKTGLWHRIDLNTMTIPQKLNVVRGAYHFYPLFEYENLDIHFADKVVASILPLQNNWGGWTIEGGNSGACEDIDAIEPLIRCSFSTPDLKNDIDNAIKKSMIWQLSCRNEDGGFSFYLNSSHEYGGHSLTSSLKNESSLFATWFRVLCLAYEMKYLGIQNEFNIGHYPGYEINLRNE